MNTSEPWLVTYLRQFFEVTQITTADKSGSTITIKSAVIYRKPLDFLECGLRCFSKNVNQRSFLNHILQISSL